MRGGKITLTIYDNHTPEGLADACRSFAEYGWPRCPVGWFFSCPLMHLGNGRGRCEQIKAKDWEAVIQEGLEEDKA